MQQQPEHPDPQLEDVLSMGEDGKTSRWGRLGAVLVVLLLALGAYRLVSGPSTPGAPDPAAAAAGTGSSDPAFTGTGRRGSADVGTQQATRLRLGGRLVTLHGPGVQQAHRETSAKALGRVRHGWLVQLTSKACEGRTDPQVLYGVAAPSGRFTQWEASTTARRPQWRSPNGSLALVSRGEHLRVKQVSTGRLLADFRTTA